MKYVVATVMFEASNEFAENIDAPAITTIVNQHLESFAGNAHVVRTIVTKCYTLEEALAVTRKGAP